MQILIPPSDHLDLLDVNELTVSTPNNGMPSSRKEQRVARKKYKQYLKSLPLKDQIIHRMKMPPKQWGSRVLANFYVWSGLLFVGNGVFQGYLVAQVEAIPMQAQALGYAATIASLGLAAMAIGSSLQPNKKDRERDIVLVAIVEKLGELQNELEQIKQETYEIKQKHINDGVQSDY